MRTPRNRRLEEEYRKIVDRCVRLGLVLSEIGEKNKITVTDDEVSRAVIERARQMPGREKEVWDYYRNNPNALAHPMHRSMKTQGRRFHPRTCQHY